MEPAQLLRATWVASSWGMFLPILSLDLSHSNLGSFLLALPSYTIVRSPTPSLPWPFGTAGDCVKCPKAIPFPRWPRPASPASPHGASAPALPPWEPHLELPPVCPRLSCAGSQNCTQYLDVVWRVPHRRGQSLPLTFEPCPWSHSSGAAGCLCCQRTPQWCSADCPLWPQGCTAELLPSPILWQCRCRVSSFPAAKQVSASRKNASEHFWVYNFNYSCEQIMKMFLPSLKKNPATFSSSNSHCPVSGIQGMHFAIYRKKKKKKP